jgi:hypothetical protein
VSFFRYDLTVRSALGQVVDGASVAVLSQPASFPNGDNEAGTPLATLWAASVSNSVNISAISWANGIVSFTLLSVPSDLVPGSYFSVSGVNPSAYNTIWQCTGVAGNVVTAVSVANPGTYISGGAVATSALPNPFLTDNLGNGFFYASPGEYTVQIFDPTYNRISPLILLDQGVLSPGSGSVTSVGLTGDGVVFSSSVPGSPIIGSGTFAPTLATAAANFVLAGPTSGGPAAWTARKLTLADLPTSLGTVSSVAATVSPDTGGILAPSVTGSPITSSGTLAFGVQFNPQAANTALMGPTLGGSATPAFRAITAADLPTVLRAVTTLSGSADALAFGSDNFVTTAGVDGMTLATPTPTTDDGKTVRVTDAGGHAHTITTSSNKIVPSHHLVTFGGTVGAYIEFEAYQGLWYPRANSGVTIS